MLRFLFFKLINGRSRLNINMKRIILISLLIYVFLNLIFLVRLVLDELDY